MAETEGALSKLLDLLFDSGHRLSKRAALMILLIAGVGLMDNYIGFSDYYAFDHKVEQVAKIEAILNRTDLDSSVRNQLQNLERQILARKSLAGYLPSLISLINKAGISAPTHTQKTKSDKIIVEKNVVEKRNLISHTLTSSWPIIFLMIGFLVSTFTRSLDSNSIAALLLIEVFLGCIAYVLAILFLQIPLLLNNPIYNYLMNISLSIILIGGLIWISTITNSNRGN